MPKLKS